MTARDWIFGSRPRRLALRFVLNQTPPEAGWTKAHIAAHCEVGPKGGADEHVRGLVALELLTERDGRYLPATPTSALAKRLADLVGELESVPEERIERLLRQRL
jgi:hypothetical protein